MTQHTPEPWIIKDQFIAAQQPLEKGDYDSAWICQWASYTNEANARLIAAAPDGLEVAKKAYVSILLLPPEIRNSFREVLCELRDFIAKATGSDFEDVQNEYEAKVRIQSQKED